MASGRAPGVTVTAPNVAALENVPPETVAVTAPPVRELWKPPVLIWIEATDHVMLKVGATVHPPPVNWTPVYRWHQWWW